MKFNNNDTVIYRNVLPGVMLLKEEYLGSLLNLTNFDYHFIIDQEHNIVEAINRNKK